MSATEALRQAKAFYGMRATFSKEQKVGAVVALAEWDIFSDRQIAAIVDLRPSIVHGVTKKTDHTGGRFDPAGIDAVLHVIDLETRGEVDVFAVNRALKECCGVYLLARFVGRPVSTLKRHAAKAVELEALKAAA